MTVKLLTAKHLEFISLKGGFTGSSESTLVKMPHCWKSHVVAHFRKECVLIEVFHSKKNADHKAVRMHDVIQTNSWNPSPEVGKID